MPLEVCIESIHAEAIFSDLTLAFHHLEHLDPLSFLLGFNDQNLQNSMLLVVCDRIQGNKLTAHKLIYARSSQQRLLWPWWPQRGWDLAQLSEQKQSPSLVVDSLLRRGFFVGADPKASILEKHHGQVEAVWRCPGWLRALDPVALLLPEAYWGDGVSSHTQNILLVRLMGSLANSCGLSRPEPSVL